MAHNAVRGARIQRGGRIFMVPMDHGISMGPSVLPDPVSVLQKVADLATCVTVHKGLVPQVAPFADRLAILMHLSASTDVGPDPQEKRLVATVAEAVRMGCDGVSTHLNMGSVTEPAQLEAVGAVSTACQEWGMPHLAMVYPRGPGIQDPTDPGLVAHAARLGAELGADVVKVPYTGDAGSFRDVVAGAGVPVIVAGGPKGDLETFTQAMAGAATAGAAGISVGRNVFQAADPAHAMQRITSVFR